MMTNLKRKIAVAVKMVVAARIKVVAAVVKIEKLIFFNKNLRTTRTKRIFQKPK